RSHISCPSAPRVDGGAVTVLPSPRCTTPNPAGIGGSSSGVASGAQNRCHHPVGVAATGIDPTAFSGSVSSTRAPTAPGIDQTWTAGPQTSTMFGTVPERADHHHRTSAASVIWCCCQCGSIGCAAGAMQYRLSQEQPTHTGPPGPVMRIRRPDDPYGVAPGTI